jgi:hypothetical protein
MNAPARETWLPVVGFEGLYSVSDYGRVRSEARIVERRRGASYSTPTRIRKPSSSKDCPYLSLSLSRGGVNVTRYVHDLVLTAFRGPRPPGLEGCHGDGNCTNNRVGNLRWDTRKGNFADKTIHGTGTVGERHPGAKLTDVLVVSLRKRRAEGASFTKLAAEFGVNRMTAHRAATGKNWSHI